MKEIWKPIPNYNGYYEVSDQGRIRSVTRTIKTIDNKIQTFKGRVLRPDLLKRGVSYYRIKLCKGCIEEKFLVHRLVMSVFEGESDLDVDHINGIGIDNRRVNLRYTTHRQNLVDYRSRNTHKTSSRYVGVCWAKRERKWVSNISIQGVNNFLGYFHSERDAHLSYQKAFIKQTEIESNNRILAES